MNDEPEKGLAEARSKREATLFGQRELIRDMAERLQLTMPGAQRLSRTEALTLAQVAIAHNLDPFNGEVWIIPGKGVMIGIKGLRKSARRQLKEESYWLGGFTRVDDPAKYGLGDKNIVYEVELFDTEMVKAWTLAAERLQKLGLTIAEIVPMLGRIPRTIGIGAYDVSRENSKMGAAAAAMKRAEADALKRRFDVPLGVEYNVEVIASEEDATDGQFSEIASVESLSDTTPVRKEGESPEAYEKRLQSEMGFG